MLGALVCRRIGAQKSVVYSVRTTPPRKYKGYTSHEQEKPEASDGRTFVNRRLVLVIVGLNGREIAWHSVGVVIGGFLRRINITIITDTVRASDGLFQISSKLRRRAGGRKLQCQVLAASTRYRVNEK